MKLANVMPIASKADADKTRSMACWGKVPVFSSLQCVSTLRLWATQDDVSDDHLARIEAVLNGMSHGSSDLGAVEIAEIGRRLIIVDGHHRATAALRLGWRHLWASVRKPASPAKGVTR